MRSILQKSGTHYVWIRGLAYDGGSDSCHVGLDGEEVATARKITKVHPRGELVWTSRVEPSTSGVNGRAVVQVSSPGVHTLEIYAREDGFVIDKVVLATNPDFVPTGAGPAETRAGLPSGAKIISVTASSEQSPNFARNVLDQDLSTRWSTFGKGAYLTLELDREASIDRIQLAWFRGDRRTADFRIGVSTEGTHFSDVFSGSSSGRSLGLETYTFPASRARFIRVTFLGNSENDWASLTEVGLGDVGAPPPTGTEISDPVLNPQPELERAITDQTNKTFEEINDELNRNGVRIAHENNWRTTNEAVIDFRSGATSGSSKLFFEVGESLLVSCRISGLNIKVFEPFQNKFLYRGPCNMPNAISLEGKHAGYWVISASDGSRRSFLVLPDSYQGASYFGGDLFGGTATTRHFQKFMRYGYARVTAKWSDAVASDSQPRMPTIGTIGWSSSGLSAARSRINEILGEFGETKILLHLRVVPPLYYFNHPETIWTQATNPRAACFAVFREKWRGYVRRVISEGLVDRVWGVQVWNEPSWSPVNDICDHQDAVDFIPDSLKSQFFGYLTELARIARTELDSAGYQHIAVVSPGFDGEGDEYQKQAAAMVASGAKDVLTAFGTHNYEHGVTGHLRRLQLQSRWRSAGRIDDHPILQVEGTMKFSLKQLDPSVPVHAWTVGKVSGPSGVPDHLGYRRAVFGGRSDTRAAETDFDQPF